MSLDGIHVAGSFALSEDILRLHDAELERIVDHQTNQTLYNIRGMLLGKRLPKEWDANHQTVHVRVPRTWWGWRQWKRGRRVRRWRHIKVRLDLTMTATPALMFPHSTMEFPKGDLSLGRVQYSWLDIDQRLAAEVER